MKHLTTLVIGFNILGLGVVQILETWRPGSVAGLMSIGVIWSIATVTTAVACILKSRRWSL